MQPPYLLSVDFDGKVFPFILFIAFSSLSDGEKKKMELAKVESDVFVALFFGFRVALVSNAVTHNGKTSNIYGEKTRVLNRQVRKSGNTLS